MGWQTPDRAADAAERRQQREAKRRQRELERKAKEQAKLSAIEQADFEVEAYENRLDVLLSLHKEQGKVWDWQLEASRLSPPAPQPHPYAELRARLKVVSCSPEQLAEAEPVLVRARQQDEADYQVALKAYEEEVTDIQNLRTFARRVLAGDAQSLYGSFGGGQSARRVV